MRRVRFRHKTARVQHERVVRAGVIRLDLCQNRIQQVRVMNPRIEHFGRWSTDFARDQSQSGFGVNRCLVLGEDD